MDHRVMSFPKTIITCLLCVHAHAYIGMFLDESAARLFILPWSCSYTRLCQGMTFSAIDAVENSTGVWLKLRTPPASRDGDVAMDATYRALGCVMMMRVDKY